MSDDLISRQAAINALEELKELDYELYIRTSYSHLMEDHWDFVIKRYKEAIKETPCAQQRTGRWKCLDNDKNIYKCTACGGTWVIEEGTPKENEMFFCCRCGARMEVTE